MRVEFPCEQCTKTVQVEVPDDMPRGGGAIVPHRCECGASYLLDVVRPTDGDPGLRSVRRNEGGAGNPLAAILSGMGAVAIPLSIGAGAAGGRPPEQEQHGRYHELIEVEIGRQHKVAVGHNHQGQTWIRFDGGQWEPVCSSCLLMASSALTRAVLRAEAAGKLEAELSRVPLLARHRVQPGETLASIAQQHYGVRELEADLYYANRDILQAGDPPLPGDELRIPRREAAATTAPADGT